MRAESVRTRSLLRTWWRTFSKGVGGTVKTSGLSGWRKSKRSNTEQDCVEVATVLTAVGIRDSKNPDAGHLELDRPAFAGLLARVKSGDLSL
ncbi:DUF397 domain-containing protein [Actinomadura harenae]|uniref:DUF397 domain-containing protein n=1 Tax=Actinomadura harenae TaxID=2483351 RepID=A0A3M2LX81_9ACTN|nr:DUF397 domain-containing protein [Actinomadura harenae]RMI41173.1 DUF397 domain-containing protein [Actinomadura harenae]